MPDTGVWPIAESQCDIPTGNFNFLCCVVRCNILLKSEVRGTPLPFVAEKKEEKQPDRKKQFLNRNTLASSDGGVLRFFYFKTFSRSLVVILKKIQQLKVRTFSHAF